jgi:hypothetical protein
VISASELQAKLLECIPTIDACQDIIPGSYNLEIDEFLLLNFFTKKTINSSIYGMKGKAAEAEKKDPKNY